MVQSILPRPSEKRMGNGVGRRKAAIQPGRSPATSGTGQPARIAMISTHGYVAARPPLGAADTGGQVVYVLELSKKLAQLGYHVDIWTRQFAGQAPSEPVAERVRILRVPCGGPGFLPKEYLCEHLAEWNENALRLIAADGLAYRFINSHYWDAGLAGRHLAAALGIPHLHTPHSLGSWKKKQMETDAPQSAAEFERRYNFRRRIAAEQQIYQECDTVLATTPSQRELIIQDYSIPEARVGMVPAGYDDTRFFAAGEPTRAAIRARLGFHGKVILALGRLARNKGYDLLVDAFSFVARREADAMLHLAVGGSEMNDNERTILAELKERAARTGFGDRIHFGSFIPDEELPDYYRAADLFALSSRYEPFGMTAIEAMASGVPTVVTIHGGLHRVLSFGRHAVFADPFDPKNLGAAMCRIFRNARLRERLSLMGAHLTRNLFTWTGVAQQLVALIEPRPAPALAAPDEAPG